MAANGGGAGRGNGGGAIPAAFRRMVMSLKEIVNCSEQEIYAMLHECNMDPSETVNRLLNQDTFQEVKSKREKKKEIKDIPESKSRGANNAHNRGRFSTDRGGRVVTANSSSNGRSKSLMKKESDQNTVLNSSVQGHSGSGSLASKHPSPSSGSTSMDLSSFATLVTAVESTSVSSKPVIGHNHAWSAMPGQLSMADVVKMGRPHAKPLKPTMSSELPDVSQDALTTSNWKLSLPLPIPSDSSQERHLSLESIPMISNATHELDLSLDYASVDSWSRVDPLPADVNSTVVLSNVTVLSDPSDPSSLQEESLNLPVSSTNANEIYANNKDSTGVTFGSINPITGHDRQPCTPTVDDASFESRGFCEQSEDAYQNCEDYDEKDEISSVVSNLQHVTLQKEDVMERPRDDNPSVIFPDNLQVSVDCSHLSFGSFGSGISANFSNSLLSKTQKGDLEVNSNVEQVTLDQLDASIHGGKSEHFEEEQLRTSEEDLENVAVTSAENYDHLPSPQPTAIESTASDTSEDLQYKLKPSMSSYPFTNASQPSAVPHSYSETISPPQDLSALSNVMQAYSLSLPSNVSQPAIQAGREFEIPYSSSLAQQLLVKYNSGISSLTGPAVSIPENVKPSLFSILQPASQPSASTSLPTGPSVPQHLPIPHHYSQPTFPLEPLASMMGYPYVPPSYPPYLPSAFQQTYSGSNAYHQSLAACGIKYVPAYKSSMSASNLPESAMIQSSYGGGFGSSTNIPENFVLAPQTVSASTTLGYSDGLTSHQFKDGNHYSSLHQAENPSLWLQQAASSRTTLPTNAFYNLSGQSQHSAFRQLQQHQQQQPSQYGTPSFLNFYSHSGASQELPQNSNSGNLNRSQGIPSQSSHQLWPSNY